MAQPGLHLSRQDPDRNMARFYALELERDLFGDWVVVRYWGRIGTRGQSLRNSFPSLDAARNMIRRVTKAKIARGYALRAG